MNNETEAPNRKNKVNLYLVLALLCGFALGAFLTFGLIYINPKILGDKEEARDSQEKENVVETALEGNLQGNTQIETVKEELDTSNDTSQIIIKENENVFENTLFNYSMNLPVGWDISGMAGGKPELDSVIFIDSPLCDSFLPIRDESFCSHISLDVIKISSYDAMSTSDNKTYVNENRFHPSFIIDLETEKVINEQKLEIDGEEAKSFEYFQANYDENGRWLLVIVTNHNGYHYTFTYEEQRGNCADCSVNSSSPNWLSKTDFEKIIYSFVFEN